MPTTSAKPPAGPLLGAHVSIAGGVHEAPARGRQIGCDCIQIFTKSSRQWAAKPYAQRGNRGVQAQPKEQALQTVIAHDSYLLNLGAPDQKLRERSVKDLSTSWSDARRSACRIWWRIRARTSDRARRPESPRSRTRSTRRTSACAGFKVKLALEITAGQGSSAGLLVRADGPNLRRGEGKRAAEALLRHRARLRRRLRSPRRRRL